MGMDSSDIMKGLTSITTIYFDVKTRFCSSHFMKISSTVGRWMPPEARPMILAYFGSLATFSNMDRESKDIKSPRIYAP
jgi:hypothetical protein